MSKLVILKIGAGDFNNGFPVTMQIESDGTWIAERDGQLPPAPMIPEQYSEWRAKYSDSDRGLGFRVLEATEGQVKNISVVELAADLQNSLNQWLVGREFIPIKEGLLDNLNITDNILFIIKAQDKLLQRLPWHLCALFERYLNAEVVISNPYQPVPNSLKRLKDKVRILVILGVNSDINVQADLYILKDKLPDAEIVPLIATSREQLNNQLWEQEWDMLFFAGHSCSDFTNGQGRFYINEHESITIKDLKYGLRNAIKKGLKLAIFNSCDGLGLAQGLADLQMPAIVVMRERVPDGAAQKFLEYFLQAFAVKEMSLYASVREARERLCGLENLYPCASWLPVLCQHVNAEPLTWIGLREIEEPDVEENPPVFHQLVSQAIKHKVKVGILLFGFVSVQFTSHLTSHYISRALNQRVIKNHQDSRFVQANSAWQLATKLNQNNRATVYNQGWLCEKVRDLECAREKYQIAAQLGLPAAYSQLGRLYIIKEKDYAAAVDLLWTGLMLAKQDPVKYTLHKNMGWARLEQGRYREASEHLQAAIELDNDRASAYCLLAQVLERQGDREGAIAEWKSCLRYAIPQNPDEDRWIGMARQVLESVEPDIDKEISTLVENSFNNKNKLEMCENQDGNIFCTQ